VESTAGLKESAHASHPDFALNRKRIDGRLSLLWTALGAAEHPSKKQGASYIARVKRLQASFRDSPRE